MFEFLKTQTVKFFNLITVQLENIKVSTDETKNIQTVLFLLRFMTYFCSIYADIVGIQEVYLLSNSVHGMPC